MLLNLSGTDIFNVSMMMSEAFGCIYTENDVINMIYNSFISIGYIKNDVLIGYAGLLKMYSDITLELHPLVIKEGYRNMGIGTKLLKEAERMAKEKKCIKYYAWF